MAFLWPRHPKTTESIFSFPEFVPAYKKSVYSIRSFFRWSVSESHDQTGHTYFWPWPPQKFLIYFSFLWIYIDMQKISYSICSFFRYSQFLSPVTRPDWSHPFLTMPTPKIFKHLLNCMNSYQHGKNQLIQYLHSSDTANLRVQRPDWPHSFFDHVQQKVFDQLLLFLNLYKHAKNEAVSSICSGEMVDLKTLESDWLRPFWPISQEQDFSEYRICAGIQYKFSL